MVWQITGQVTFPIQSSTVQSFADGATVQAYLGSQLLTSTTTSYTGMYSMNIPLPDDFNGQITLITSMQDSNFPSINVTGPGTYNILATTVIPALPPTTNNPSNNYASSAPTTTTSSPTSLFWLVPILLGSAVGGLIWLLISRKKNKEKR